MAYAEQDTFDSVHPPVFQTSDMFIACRKALAVHSEDSSSLLDFIRSYETPVYVLKDSWIYNSLLSGLDIQPGFVTPKATDRKFQCLVRWLLEQDNSQLQDIPKPVLEDRLMKQGFFLLTEKTTSTVYLAYQMYHWVSFSTGLEGYSEQSQNLYQQFCKKPQVLLKTESLKQMTEQETKALQGAIKRECEALSFLKEMTQEVFIPLKHSKHLAANCI